MSAQPVKLPAIFAGIQSKVDRSYKLTFVTRELSGDDASVLLKMNQSELWMLLAPTEDAIDRAEVPAYKPDAEMARKTPSQRLRSVLFLVWKQSGQPGSFDDYYRGRLEHLIELYKAKLDGEEVV